MNEEDYLALRNLVQQLLLESGLSEIADDENYLLDEDDEDGSILPDPQTHLIKLLQAFRRHLAVSDRRLIISSLERIDEATSNKGPESVVVEPLSRRRDSSGSSVSDSEVVFLNRVPDHGDLIGEIDALIAELDKSDGTMAR